MTSNASMEHYRKMMISSDLTAEEKNENAEREDRRVRLEQGSEEHAARIRNREVYDEKRNDEILKAREEKKLKMQKKKKVREDSSISGSVSVSEAEMAGAVKVK